MFEDGLYEKDGAKLSYLIDYPKGFNENEKHPVIFDFHGMGQVGKGIDVLRDGISVRREYMNEDMPVIIVAPYCEEYTWLGCLPLVNEFLDYFISKKFIDSDRVYITGSSMGGYTCWALGIMYPEKFAAGVICCGGGMYFAADRISFPVWAFHGKDDTVVLPRESEIMVKRINDCGGNAKLTVLEGWGHNVWEAVFYSPEIYEWLLSNRKNGALGIK